MFISMCLYSFWIYAFYTCGLTSCCVQSRHNTFTYSLPFSSLPVLRITLRFLPKLIVTVYLICRYGLPQNQLGNCDYLSCAMFYFVIVSYLQSFLGPIYFFLSDLSMAIDSLFKTSNYQLTYLFYIPPPTQRVFVGPLCPVLQSLGLRHSGHLEFFLHVTCDHLPFWDPVSGFPRLPLSWLTPSWCRIVFSSGFLRKDTGEPIIFRFRDISEMSLFSLLQFLLIWLYYIDSWLKLNCFIMF